jgi:AbrB family looped-hinge helix DNA binding protein
MRVDGRLAQRTLTLFVPKNYHYKSAINMTAIATLSSKYQIPIPKSVRKERNWKAGQQLALIPKGMGVLIMPIPTLEQLSGLVKSAKTTGYRERKGCG